jgi:integrase
MAKISKRHWTGSDGKPKQGWVVDFIDRSRKRRRRQFKSRKAADAFMVEARAQDAAGQYVHAPSSVTVETAAGQWKDYLDTLQAAGQLEARTVDNHKSKIDNHVLSPTYGLGAEKMADINFRRIETFTLKAIAAGATEANMKRVVATVRVFLSWSADESLIAANPLQGRRLNWSRGSRQAQETSMAIPTHEEVGTLIKLAQDRAPWFALYLRFAALTGLRASEQRAIQWSDLDLTKRTVRVHHRVDMKGREGPTKSTASVRTVPLAPKLAQSLKERWLAKGRPETGYVFPNTKGGVIDHNNIAHRHWRPILDKAGLSYRWHDLRHFAASSWLQAGVNLKEVQRRIGHADHGVTLAVYAHTFPEQAEGAELDAIESRLS